MSVRSVLILLAATGGFAALAATSAATAGPGIPPAAAIASDLGVGVDSLVSCTNDARSNAEGQRGSPERREAIKALVLSCLQQTRPEITAAQLDAAMAKHRPAAATASNQGSP